MLQRILGTGLGLVVLALGATTAQKHQNGNASLGDVLRPAAPQKRNILVIVVDDLGTDKLGFYGETPPTCAPGTCQLPPNCVPLQTGCVERYPATPNLDELRSGGILFTQAYVTPVCSSTRAWLQTGRYGFRTGIGRATSTVQIPGDFGLSSDETFLAEFLRFGFPFSSWNTSGLPYKCGAFGKWHLSTTLPEDQGHAVENGYQHFRGTMGNVGNFFRYDWVSHNPGSSPTVVRINGVESLPPFTADTWQASVAAREARDWINAQNNSFLAYVAFGPPHTPLQVPPFELLPAETQCELTCAGLVPGDFLSLASDPPELLRLVFKALTEALDTEIGNLLHGITPERLANTMVFFVSDNGTPSFVVDNPPHDPTHAKGHVYDLGARVPMIVSGPLVKHPIPSGGWTSDALVSGVDLWRTIGDITGADEALAPPAGPLDSISFYPVLRDPLSSGNRDIVFTQYFSPNGVLTLAPPSCYDTNARAMSDGVYKYVRTQIDLDATPCGTPTYYEELFELASDPEESINLLTGTPPPAALTALATLQAEMDALSGL